MRFNAQFGAIRLAFFVLAGAIALLIVFAQGGALGVHFFSDETRKAEGRLSADGSRTSSWGARIEGAIAADMDALNAFYDRMGFDLERIAAGEAVVPRLYLSTLPEDIHKAKISDRKAAFLRSILPIILAVNAEISEEREKLLALRDQAQRGAALSSKDMVWLLELSRKYNQSDGNLDRLALKVDSIPVSLALAQAIAESGWGTSRIAREQNALYGQFVDREATGYRAFSDLYGTVSSYARNLNSHGAYADFRKRRATMRMKGLDLDAEELALGLGRYSELGGVYIQKICDIIKGNQLSVYDRASLDEEHIDLSIAGL